MMKLILCSLIVIVSIISTDAIACTKDICNSVKCRGLEPKDCEPGSVYKRHGGFCGCCPVCIKLLKEGQLCGGRVQSLVRGGSPPTSECEPPLVCKSFSSGQPLKCTDPYQSPPFYDPIEYPEYPTDCYTK
ncbi:fungal protease inhibitor-1-like [Panonychus citri]|uniref:fungal protease inhibitor-1-like n=1 Tax=Panonychus citri TaxID=50023 RepID=UPI0023072673|nr:fungal protease inhibitor-1-like [Panonychus citri]